MEILKTMRLCAVAALAALTMAACSDDDDNPTAPEKEMLVTKMEHKVKYVMEAEGFEDFFAGSKNDITEMKYDGQGRLFEWIDNGKSRGLYTYEKGKIILTNDPKNGSIEFKLNENGLIEETVFADGTVDKVTYNDKGQCVEVNQGGNYRTLFEWTGDDMTFISFPDLEDNMTRIGLTITYSDMPKKSNAPYLRYMMSNYNGYRIDLEVAGALQISSEKYLPVKAVMEWVDGYQQIYEATYERDADGVVTVMHVIYSHRDNASSEPYAACIYDLEFTYQQK